MGERLPKNYDEFIGLIINNWFICDQKSRDKTWFVCKHKCGYVRQNHIKTIIENTAKCPKCETLNDLQKYVEQKYNSWKILSIEQTQNNRLPYQAKCQCKCGNIKIQKVYEIVSGRIKQCKDCYNDSDLTGEEFNKLNVQSFSHLDRHKKKIWLCLCKCGNEVYATTTDLRKNKTTQCKECCSEQQYKGCGELSASFFSQIRGGATQRGLELEVDIYFLWDLFLKQNRKCAYTGLDIVLDKDKSKITASLDRTDSSKGYLKDNVKWVHKTINKMKQNLSEEEFLIFCDLVSSNKKAMSYR